MSKEKRIVYADNAATTRVADEVIQAMIPCFGEIYGNPSSIHTFGRNAKIMVEDARKKIADLLNCEATEIYFTSGGTESDNWAITTAIKSLSKKGKHIISSCIEHHAILHTLKEYEKQGYDVTYLNVDSNGLVSVDDFRNAIREDTIFASIMYVNNEIGTVQPIKELSSVAKEKGVAFHTDAVQAVGHIPVDISDLGVTMLSAAGHKFNGPKGVGFLYVNKKFRIYPSIHGGGHEKGKRAGTENVPSIVGLAKSLEISCNGMVVENERLAKMRDKLEAGLLKLERVRLNGDKSKRLPGLVNISVEFIEGEALLLMLDLKGISASSGSACTSGSLDPSHVLLALGLSHEIAHGSLRLSLGRYNTEQDVDYILDVIPEIINKLRIMSPLYENYVKGITKTL